MGWILLLVSFYKDDFDNKQLMKDDMPLSKETKPTPF